MAVEEFYVTLPSNSSGAYYPDNTLSDFTTKLFKPIDLTGEWEVADRNQFPPLLLQYHGTLQQDTLQREWLTPQRQDV